MKRPEVSFERKKKMLGMPNMLLTVLQFHTHPISCSCDRSLENGMKSTMLRRALDLLEPAAEKHSQRNRYSEWSLIKFIYKVVFMSMRVYISPPLWMALSFRSVLAKVWIKSAKAPWRLSSSWQEPLSVISPSIITRIWSACGRKLMPWVTRMRVYMASHTSAKKQDVSAIQQKTGFFLRNFC